MVNFLCPELDTDAQCRIYSLCHPYQILLFCFRNENEEIIVTGGKSSNEPLNKSERIKFTGPNTIQTEPFTALPVKIAHHAQADTGAVQLFGGDVSNVGRNFVIEYEATSSMWEMTNVTLPENLSYHHVTKYPAYLVKC